MVHPTKTLVILLCMHRCGSSLSSWLLQRLGMSLGPFELVEGCESNKYGHFEAKPFLALNRELQMQEFGFADEWPFEAEAFRRFRESDGRWRSEDTITDEAIGRGRELIHQLMESGPVCGFKDPRTVLVWPFWQRVVAGMPELRVVPLLLVRSPHEIAMSLFRRSRGLERYSDGLEVTAAHFRRMKDIYDQWTGPKAVVQFEPGVYAEQMRRAVTICGLPWSDSVLAETYDASCRHHGCASVDHPVQGVFEALAGLPPSSPDAENFRHLLADAAIRESILEQKCADAAIRESILEQKCAGVLSQSQELATAIQRISSLETELAQASNRLALVQHSKMWRLRNALVGTFFRSKGHEDPTMIAGRLPAVDASSERRRVA